MAWPVLLWIPNLVGYFRIIATVIAFSLCFQDYRTASFFYLLGQGLDAVDGMAARYFKQCSKFGAVLDMLTDRMSTATLLIVLSHLYPSLWGFFAGLVVLDVVSHWYQMYSSLVMKKSTHKGSSNPILNFYYSWPWLLIFCACNEFFLVAAYLVTQDDIMLTTGGVTFGLFKLLAYINFPFFVGKQFFSVVQLYAAVMDLIEIDAQENAKQSKA